MNRVKLKNVKLQNRYKMLVTLFTSIILVILFTNEMTIKMSSNLLNYTVARVKKENILLLKSAFANGTPEDVDIDDVIYVVKNSKEEIVEVDFNMEDCSKILKNITGYINENIQEYNYLGYRLDIPLGFMNNNPMLVNLGPKIPVKVELADIAIGAVSTVVKPFGINNALVEVYLNITIFTSIMYPKEIINADSEYSALLTSKIISGSIPEFYGTGINSKSTSIDLPLNE